MSYEVDYAQLGVAGKRAVDVAESARIDFGQMRINGVGDAIPGGISGAVADALDRSWMATGQAISGNLNTYSTHMIQTAEHYEKAEDSNRFASEQFFGGAR